MNILDFVHGVQKLQSHSETLDEIKKILDNDSSIDIVEQVKNLKENTSITNINLLSKRLNALENMLGEMDEEYSYNYDEVSSAISNLESVPSESDNCYDARKMISDLRTEILDADSNLNKEEDSDTNTAQPSA